MAAKRLVSVDIGSTYTKGGAFVLDETTHTLRRENCVQTPTCPRDLTEGFNRVCRELGPFDDCFYSSSAKGGLQIAVIGLVPEWTLKTARLCALNAGGKVVSVYSYKLTHADIAELQAANPDVILICGGTDGGDETYGRHNIQMLKQLPGQMSLIYAGNRALQTFARQELASLDLIVTDNVLPRLDQVCIEPARNAIREVFLRKIVYGKGLGEIIERIGRPPLPTPFAVLSLVEAISACGSDWSGFCVVDIGGATTDFYSSCIAGSIPDHVIVKGITEPRIKRTVEGDLGMRVSARSCFENTFLKHLDGAQALNAYAEFVGRDTDYLPQEPLHQGYDRLLAQACLTDALQRHVGCWTAHYTALGKRHIQQGKDLRSVDRMVGTGGYLAGHVDLGDRPLDRLDIPQSGCLLLPGSWDYYQDQDNLWVLLANLLPIAGPSAVKMAVDCVKRRSTMTVVPNQGDI
jgi:uncharacterized protein (TIGR01319 family)